MKQVKRAMWTGVCQLGLGLMLATNAWAGEVSPGPMTQGIESVGEAALEELRVSKVQPVVFGDSAADARLSMTMAAASGVQQVESAQVNIDVAGLELGEEGMGFAGSSTKLDIVSLQYGYLLGNMPLAAAAKGEQMKKLTDTLDAMQQLHGVYATDLGGKISKFVKSARAGKIDHVAYLEMMRAAGQGIASANDTAGQRRHAYLLLGMWTGMASMSAATQSVPKEVRDMGGMLVDLLEKDAAFGGSDRALATKIKVINGELGKSKISTAAVTAAISEMMNIEQDA